MKKNIFKILLLLVLLSPVMMLTSCEEDAPTYTYSAEDLEGAWTWTTETGDIADYFEVSISKVDETQFKISNFQSLGDITCTMTGSTTFSFSGDLKSCIIKNGKGTITSGYQKMSMNYTIVDEDDNEEQISVNLSKGGAITKK